MTISKINNLLSALVEEKLWSKNIQTMGTQQTIKRFNIGSSSHASPPTKTQFRNIVITVRNDMATAGNFNIFCINLILKHCKQALFYLS